MYIAIIMRNIDNGNTIQYSSIDMFDEDMRNWKHVRWAYLYEKKTGREVKRHLTSSCNGWVNGQANLVCLGCHKLPDHCNCLLQFTRC